MQKPITAVIVGAGHRAMLYATYAAQHPEKLRIAGVADPNPARRADAQKLYGFADEYCFESAAQLAEHEKLADAVINGTMDAQHVATSIPLLERGYHLLLEKPFALNEPEMLRLLQVARQTKRTVLICHVLRYAPFYTEIRRRILAGAIGDIINLQATEHVSYHHLAVSYIRGKWAREDECGATMLLAKCCHDMDLLIWLKANPPKRFASFGGIFQFVPGRRPKNAADRCLCCPAESDCLYSARKHYLDHPGRWAFYVWDGLEKDASPAQREQSLATSPYGRCVWACNQTAVDHQSVLIEFEDGATATLNMIGGAAKPERNLHIVGTRGEIKGVFDDSRFAVRTIDTKAETGYREEEIDLSIGGDKSGAFGGHGGGDLLLVEDFVALLQGNTPSISCTAITDSVYGHMAVFKAEESRLNATITEMPPL
ncbi:MAG: Gfo/Idh/MocA family protein [Oscillospiraceae bacterium]